jgi:outer membrane biogenesis lipoprotein LolB
VKRLLSALLLSFLLLTACGHDDPPSPGYVSTRSFEPAWDQHYTTYTCFSYDKNGACTLNMPQDNVQHFDDTWTLHIQRDKNGKNEDIDVSQAEYNANPPGTHWSPKP